MQDSERSFCFPPIIGSAPHTLILGTMPGQRSLAANQYYAHPQNQFWRIMGDIYSAGLDVSYDRRVKILKENGIAVWDVLHSCERPGSMDSAIRAESANDFESLFRDYPSIRKVVFDSATAERLYLRHVLPNLTGEPKDYARVPSPSPAYASVKYTDKLILWRQMLQAQRA